MSDRILKKMIGKKCWKCLLRCLCAGAEILFWDNFFFFNLNISKKVLTGVACDQKMLKNEWIDCHIVYRLGVSTAYCQLVILSWASVTVDRFCSLCSVAYLWRIRTACDLRCHWTLLYCLYFCASLRSTSRLAVCRTGATMNDGLHDEATWQPVAARTPNTGSFSRTGAADCLWQTLPFKGRFCYLCLLLLPPPPPRLLLSNSVTIIVFCLEIDFCVCS